MRAVLALLGMAGLTLYGSYSYFAPGSNRPQEMAELTQIQAGLARTTAPVTRGEASDAQPGPRVFSPQQPLLVPPAAPLAQRASDPANGAIIASRRSDPFDAGPAVRIGSEKTAPRAIAAVEPVATLPVGKPSVARPATEEARVALVRELQRELKRVGCFDGEITGAWGVASKRAMGDFTGRVNASLPVESPDYILLSLVKGHSGLACGPREQVIAAGRPRDAQTATLRPEPLDDKALEGRAAAMASQLANAPFAPRPQRVTETGSFPPAATASSARAAQPATRPASKELPPSARAVAQAEASLPVQAQLLPPPLPGRMAIGATPLPGGEVAPPIGGRLAALPETGAAPPAGWDPRVIQPDLDPSLSPPGALRTPATPRRTTQPRGDGRQRSAQYDRAASYYYDSPSGRAASANRQRNSSLKNSGNVRDFFFGPGRGSF